MQWNNCGARPSFYQQAQKLAALFLLAALALAMWDGERLWDSLSGTPRGNELLFCASGSGSGGDVDKALEQGAEINARSPSGCTPLIIASGAGNVAAVRALLSRGADAFLKADAGIDALYVAIANNHFEVVKILLDAGANPNSLTGGETSLDVALRMKRENVVALLKDRDAKRARDLKSWAERQIQ